ncbi:polyphosphate polymerase domain-containing protein [Novipirellula artificiosorum]|uniref:VTC domain protein n=1 Tax=Novipirellula artificiosorum TaxID=2528016 RepID=A0A5C6CZ16_9BACT|nr:polyphosphate polymerase domain-containing protein [Novipirellula artificiosorum]TWU28741.1 VTC domain protein [Novipirellula artificiosorum]
MINTNNKRLELKYVIDHDLSQQVKRWAREHLGVDAYCDPSLHDSYEVHTLYLDSAEMDLFYQTGVVGRTKFRVRRYGMEPKLWLETKRKKNQVVRKERTEVSEAELLRRVERLQHHAPQSVHDEPRDPGTLGNPNSVKTRSDEEWCGDWFLDRVADHHLQPTVEIYYRRFARTSVHHGEPLRLTIDSHLRAMATHQWPLSRINPASMQPIDDVEVLELKFNNRMPQAFKELLRTFPIAMTGFSKFRGGVDKVRTTAYPMLVPEPADDYRNVKRESVA